MIDQERNEVKEWATVNQGIKMDKVFSLCPQDYDALDKFLPNAVTNGNLVLFLCAGWCGTCISFKDTVSEVQAIFPHVMFVWLDIEDDSAVVGDVDIVNFPTLAVFRHGVPVHYGVSLPHQGVVKRLLNALLNNPVRQVDLPQEVADLPEKILQWLSSNPQETIRKN